MLVNRTLERRNATSAIGLGDMRWAEVDVTPEVARETLRANKANRNISHTRVSAYARDMKEGRWRPNPHGIILSVDGAVLDGQHRLHAVIEAGVTVRMTVCRGAAEEVREVVDQNRPRTAADVMRMRGYTKNRIASVAKYLVLLEQGEWMARLTTAETIACVQRYERARRWYEDAEKPRRLGATSYFGALIWLYDAYGHDVEKFHESYVSGANLRTGSPVLALRNFYLTNESRRTAVNNARHTLKALNAFKAYTEGVAKPRIFSSIKSYLYFAERLGYPVNRDCWLLRRVKYTKNYGGDDE